MGKRNRNRIAKPHAYALADVLTLEAYKKKYNALTQEGQRILIGQAAKLFGMPLKTLRHNLVNQGWLEPFVYCKQGLRKFKPTSHLFEKEFVVGSDMLWHFTPKGMEHLHSLLFYKEGL